MDTPTHKILLIDDDEDDYVLIRDMLSETQQAGYKLDWAPTFDAGLQALGREEHDAILLDYRLGPRSGLELLREAMTRGFRAPIIVLTGQGAYSVDVEAMRAGAADYFDKAQLTVPLLERSLRYAVERKEHEEALRASEARYRSLIEAIPCAITLTDLEGHITWANHEAARIAEVDDPAELLGKTAYDIIAPEDHERLQEYFLRTVKEGKTTDVEYTALGSKGRSLPVIAAAVVVKDASGTPTSVISIVTDVSEQKHLEEQFLHAQKMEAVGRLAGGVAHDFNNMLTVINGYAQLALGGMEPKDPLYDDVQQILSAGQRSADLVRQLLAFARRQTIAPQVLDLNDTLSGMLKMLHRLIGEDIDLLWKPGADMWPVLMDPAQLDQILANLTVNARDAIAGVGQVTIATDKAVLDESHSASHLDAAPGEYVVLAVSDDGCGMNKQTLGKLFEPFFTTKEVGKGTGLGLATVYGIVKQNGGLIDVHSEPGKGTTFRIYLPRHWPGQQAEESQPVAAATPAGAETVLLVEDDAPLLLVTTRFLQDLGYTVLPASDSNEALLLARDHVGKVHLLLTDVVMPAMCGLDLWHQVTALRPGAKCLFMSGYTANVIAHRGVLDPGVQFLPKPFTRETLATKVREALAG
jgi:PAS domain S-box-containing protein